MANFSQANAPRFIFKIGGAEFKVVEFRVVERISEPFAGQFQLASEEEIQFDDMVGKTGLLRIESGDCDRCLHGIVLSFGQNGTNGRFFLYEAELVPQIQLLDLERDCRIFQNKSVPDIVKEILQDSGMTGDTFDFRLQGNYVQREYCVQYRESDLQFISRLLEEEGIFYFFEHSAEKHLMTFGDGTVNYQPIAGDARVIFNPGGAMVAEEEAVISFRLARQIRSGKYTLRDYNFEKPSLDLTVDHVDKENEKREVYDYPGEYTTTDEGKRLAQVRMQQAVLFKEQAQGRSVVPRFVPGFTFALENHAVDGFNKDYLLIEAVHAGAQPQVLAEKSTSSEGTRYENAFTAIPSTVTLRPEIKTPKPVVEGVQTAIVTGPSGEEIYTDKHGRVKVQFHWDRRGKHDDKSSCWMRVSQVWAGAGWGAMFIPRIGQEVIVDFVEGDPDRPIITGRLYHGTNTPPYILPGEKTKSTIMSKTTPDGKTFNELVMEDKANETRVVLSNAYGHKMTMDEKEQFICIETRDGNKLVLDDKNKHISILTTNNHNILISDDKKKITVSSSDGHTLELDDGNQKMVARTKNGHRLALDDQGNKIEVVHESGGHSILMDDKSVNLASGGGHSVVVADGGAGQGIKLEDSGGNKVHLDTGANKLIIDTQGGIELTTQGDLKISAVNIHLDATADLKLSGGMNVSSEAGMNHESKGMTLKAEGQTTADFRGGMQTIIAGGLVMIN